MTYHIFPESMEEKNPDDNNMVGESSFNNFWTGLGWDGLQRISELRPDLLDTLVIIKSNGKQLNVDEFLKEIDALKIIQH